MTRSEPIGICKVQSVEGRREHANAVYVRVWVIDEAEQRFYFDAACFNFDLRAQEIAPGVTP